MSEYHAYIPGLRSINGSDWMQRSAQDLHGASRKFHFDDLVEDKGPIEKIFLSHEMESAKLRAEHMNERLEELVVTLIVKTIFKGQLHKPSGSLYTESVVYSQLESRIADMRHNIETNQDGASMKVILAYSQETGQMFYWNDIETFEKPRMPKYDQEYERKRTTYRNSASGVIR
ncbi:MAG: hypothetical protein KAJ93_04945 [Methanosarcinales archaeon]|nr:hypothetical protein [Methanosarcinales archaeon]